MRLICVQCLQRDRPIRARCWGYRVQRGLPVIRSERIYRVSGSIPSASLFIKLVLTVLLKVVLFGR